MPHRYSKTLLHQLRNDVDVAALIRDVLRLPYKTPEGAFRFACPCCQGFDCATNPKTNLARCFPCQRNFNPIDLVIAVHHCTFVDAVEFLRRHLPLNSDRTAEQTPLRTK